MRNRELLIMNLIQESLPIYSKIPPPTLTVQLPLIKGI